MPPVKAKLENLVSGDSVAFQFNPTEYALTRAVNWKAANEKGANVPKQEFEGGQPTQLVLKLMFDTTDTGEDVRKQTNKLWDLTMVDARTKDSRTKKGRPPHCRFTWGNVWSFEAVVTNINQNFTLFLEDGTPIRTTVDVTLKQVKDVKSFPAQNPTSGGLPDQRTHVVRQGERLDTIANEEYGDPAAWRHVAAANNIENPRKMKPGTVLSLPPIGN
ncbi:MAG: peptidoglycan-binding protein [Dehalococcoidia bacterium]